jgi:tetratricopeptide (TPR) repeat protein
MLILSRFKPHWPLKNHACQYTALGIMLFLLSGITSAKELPSASIGSVLEHANTLYSKKDFDGARREFEHATQLDKGSLSAWRGLGWSHWALGQKDRAYQIWSDMVKAFPVDLPTLLALAKAGEQDHRLNEAADYYAQVLKIHPNDLAAHQGRARIFITQHNFHSAEQELRAILINEPSNNGIKSLLADTLMGQGRYQEAEGLLRNLTQAEPMPTNLRRLAMTLAELGKYEQAATYYKTSYGIQVDDDTLSAWRGLGASLRKVEQNQRAYEIWNDLHKNVPNDLATLLALGRASEQDERWQQALDYYAQVLQKSPIDQSAHLGRARIFSTQKDYKAAELEIKSVLARSPSDIDAKFALAENLVAMNRRDEAEQTLHSLEGINQPPKNLRRLGAILADLGKDEESAKYFQKSLEIDADADTAVVGLAHAYWNQHRYNESVKLLQSYLTTHPDNDVVRARLAEHAQAAGNWDLAERELRTLVDKHPEEDIKWKIRLAKLLHTAGHHEEAVKLATEIITKYPDEITAADLLASDAMFSGDLESAIHWTKRLSTIAPTPERLVRLGKLNMDLGDRLTKEGKQDAAVIRYGAATEAFRLANALDPIRTGAPVEMVESLRRQGSPAEALNLGSQLHAKFPTSIDVIKQLAVSYREQGDYTAARKMLEKNTPYFSDSPVLKQSLAELTYYEGDKEAAFKILNELLDASSPTIPVLLYHGITVSDHQDTVPLRTFRDQLLALKQEGYHSITLAQLLGFFEGKTTLPTKPILITFDDARSDSFQYADPVLMETGFQATMFIPVGDVAMHQPYAAVWPTVRKMFATGRWDMQCHGEDAQHHIPVDPEGHLGHFLANRMWMADSSRLETNEEYAARIEHDLLTCKKVVAHELPDSKVFAFAFPYGDQGHRSLSNAPDAFNINQGLVKKHFKLAFNVDNTYPVTAAASRFTLPRFEVPRSLTGKDLVLQLKIIDPALSASYKLARLDVEAGRYGQALEIFDKLAQEKVVDNADLFTTSGKVLKWSDDHAGAREKFEKALTFSPNNPAIQEEIAGLDRRTKPVVQVNSQYYQDNAHRSYYSLSPSAQFHLSDKLSLSAYYKFLDFSQTLTSAHLGTPAGQEYQATGNQFEGHVGYELGPRSSLSMSAGAADFSGHSSPTPSKTAPIFPLGSVNLNIGVGDRFDLSLAADHTYVNTAGAILNGIAFTRGKGGFKVKLLDKLSLSASHAYFAYSDNNQRNRTEIDLESPVWNDPDITVGAQLIHDNTRNINPLFWTPNNYWGLSAPINLKKKWGQSVVAEVNVAPGMGKEAGSDFQFQVNSTGSINWNVRDDLSLYVSVGRYQAATFSNFNAFAGVSLRF